MSTNQKKTISHRIEKLLDDLDKSDDEEENKTEVIQNNQIHSNSSISKKNTRTSGHTDEPRIVRKFGDINLSSSSTDEEFGETLKLLISDDSSKGKNTKQSSSESESDDSNDKAQKRSLFSDSLDSSTDDEEEQSDLAKEQFSAMTSLKNESDLEFWVPSMDYEAVYKIYSYFNKEIPFLTILCTIHECYGDLEKTVFKIAQGQTSNDVKGLLSMPSEGDKDQEMRYYS